jgi:hypothetical protein
VRRGVALAKGGEKLLNRSGDLTILVHTKTDSPQRHRGTEAQRNAHLQIFQGVAAVHFPATRFPLLFCVSVPLW